MPRVTSDSKTFRKGGELGRCESCGLIQKPLTSLLYADMEEVYRDYAMFAQSSSLSEQAIFNLAGGIDTAHRSMAVAKCLAEHIRLPAQGACLDVGSGTGSFLRAFAEAFPGWRLCAQDLDSRYEPYLKTIPGFEKFYAGSLDNLSGHFDIISLSHVIEHFTNPVKILRLLAEHLTANGAIVIQIPDVAENVFDLVVCDHLSHFTAATFFGLAKAAGFGEANIQIWRGVVPKQITGILSRAATWKKFTPLMPSSASYDIGQALQALLDYQEIYLRFISRHERIALFGVATAATWFAAIDLSKVAFFVDEDKSRIGSMHLGVRVLAPAEVPQEIPVFVGLAPLASQRAICARLAMQGLTTQEVPENKRAFG